MIFRFDGAQKRFHTNLAWKHVLNHQSYGSFNTFISGLMKCTNGRNETDEDTTECVASIANKNQWLSYWTSEVQFVTHWQIVATKESASAWSIYRVKKVRLKWELQCDSVKHSFSTYCNWLAINAELCCQMGHEAHLHFCRLNYGPFIWRILQCTYEL